MPSQITLRPVADADLDALFAQSGFEVVGTNRDYAAGRDAEIEETILRLG